jgi:hypothetical protein
MSIYHEEAREMVDANGLLIQMGMYFGLYLAWQQACWPRMRAVPEAVDQRIKEGFSQGIWSWGQDLKARCEALGITFLPRMKNFTPLLVPLAKLGIKKPIQLPPIPKKRRPRRRRRQ